MLIIYCNDLTTYKAILKHVFPPLLFSCFFQISNIKPRKSFAKTFRSNIKRSTDTASSRGARLEDDFVSHSSSDDDREAVAAELLRHHHPHHHPSIGGRIRRLPGNAASGGGPGNFHRTHQNINSNNSRSSSGYNSGNYTATASSINSSVRSRGQQNGIQEVKVNVVQNLGNQIF